MAYKLETRGLTKSYGTTVALHATDLGVQSGEFLTLLGPSGSGKTTLLQMISGLVEPTAGRLFLDGIDKTTVPTGERGIGMVFQSYALFPHLTVAENVAYPLRMRSMPRAHMPAVIRSALGMVKMESFAERYPRELSGGQQQRVALARCFVYRPSVILLDEPLGALDKKLREHMQLEIRKLHRELGATFVYVTHDQEEALTLSDRICLMNQARLEQVGTPQEIYDRPRTRFAADFIGHSNILDGHVVAGDGIVPQLRVGEHLLPLPSGTTDGMAAGPLALLVRPEQARLTAPAEGHLRGTVTEMVFTGSDFRTLVDIGAGQRFSVRTPRHTPCVPGEAVGVVWEVSASSTLAG